MSWADPTGINDSVGARSFIRMYSKEDMVFFVDSLSSSTDERLFNVKANERILKDVTKKFRQVRFEHSLPDSAGILRRLKISLTAEWEVSPVLTTAVITNAIALPKNFAGTPANVTKFINGEL
jgi:hypothetical protein